MQNLRRQPDDEQDEQRAERAHQDRRVWSLRDGIAIWQPGQVTLVPDNGELAAILSPSEGAGAVFRGLGPDMRKPPQVQGLKSVTMVAGTCSNQKLRTQESRPDGAAGVRDAGSQFEMVAGASNHLKLRLLSAYRAILEHSVLANSSGLLRSAA